VAQVRALPLESSKRKIQSLQADLRAGPNGTLVAK
jgi:hypothetical protein